MQVLNIFHVLIAIGLIVFVLIQRGQGATAGAAFGSGASGTVFGARGAGNFLSRTTWVLAALFCAISLTMAVLVSRIMDTPDTELGVVTALQPAVQEEELQREQDQSVSPVVEAAPDLPSMAPAEPAPAAVEDVIGDAAADDLPPVSAEQGDAAPDGDEG